MTEEEFQGHRIIMAMDPAEKTVHLLKLIAPMMAGLLSSWGNRTTVSERQLDPWAAAMKDRDDAAAEARVQLWLETQMGFKG